MVSSSDILKMLDEKAMEYSLYNHERVYTIAEMDEVDIPNKESISKNIVLSDDKKSTFFLVSVKHDKRLDLKELRRMLKSRPLSFLNPERMEEIIAIKKGEVTPFALLNDENHLLTFILDKSFLDDIIGIHPNDNSMTLFLQASDLISILKERGESVVVMDLPYQN